MSNELWLAFSLAVAVLSASNASEVINRKDGHKFWNGVMYGVYIFLSVMCFANAVEKAKAVFV